jgi:hypothetical protein
MAIARVSYWERSKPVPAVILLGALLLYHSDYSPSWPKECVALDKAMSSPHIVLDTVSCKRLILCTAIGSRKISRKFFLGLVSV